MGKDKHKEKSAVEFKAVMPLDKVKSYLLDLLAGMDDGSICVQSGDACAVLEPKEMVKVQVEAKEKKDKCKFSLKLTWENDMEAKGDNAGLIISSSKPEPAEAQKETAGDEMTEDEKAEIRRHGD